MYLGDPREQQICPDEHTIWEEDNRVEKRYQWGARILDLCDLDPKEYAQTIFNVRNVETKKDSIELTFTNSTANFAFPYPPSSDIYIVIKDSDKKYVYIAFSDISLILIFAILNKTYNI